MHKNLWTRTRRSAPKNDLGRSWALGAACCILAAAVFNGFSQESRDPLLDLMIEKGMISQEEARKVQIEAEARKARIEANAISTNAAAIPTESKWKVSKAVKSIELYGDLRVRYEHRQASSPDDSRIELDRERAALRFGLRGELIDDFYYGFRLDTASNPRSPWISFGTSSSGLPYQGPFGKSTAGINVGHIYLGWRPSGWVDLTVGKMPNPLYTTAMIWDNDLNPEGLAERFKYTVGQADFFAAFGQFLYQDANPTHTAPGFFNLGFENANPAFVLAWQAGMNYRLNQKLSLKVGPALYNYAGGGVNITTPGSTLAPDFAGTFVGEGSTNSLTGNTQGWSGYPLGLYDGFTANQTGINDLLVLEVPWELNFKLEKFNFRLFGDYAQNLEGGNRARAAFLAAQSAFQPVGGGGIALIPSPQTQDTKAYQVGFAIGNRDSLGLVYGQTSRKHAWEARAYWQHVEQYALDPNLLDSDFFHWHPTEGGI
jgi:hypothetical protein